MIDLAATILIRRNAYYAALEAANKDNNLTPGLWWFTGITSRTAGPDRSGRQAELEFGAGNRLGLARIVRELLARTANSPIIARFTAKDLTPMPINHTFDG